MMIIISIAAILLGLWILPSERQRRFCEQLKADGGLYRVHAAETPKELLGRFKREPKWYDHYFYSLQEVVLASNDKGHLDQLNHFTSLKMLTIYGQIKNSEIEQLSQIRSLESLVISTGGNENKRDLISVATLQNLSKLKTLGLMGPRIRSADLEYLSRMKSLVALSIEFDAESIHLNDFRYFGELPALETLRLSGLAIEEGQYGFIESCKNLNDFELQDSSFGDRSVKFLANCKRLQVLQLTNVKLTDQGLVDMPALPKLEEIWLDKVSVTLQGLRHLKKFTNLKEVQLNSILDESGDKEELQNVLPNVTVD